MLGLVVAVAWAEAPRETTPSNGEVHGALTTSHGRTHQEPGGTTPLPADYGTPVVGFTGLRGAADVDLLGLRGGRLSAVGALDLRLEMHALPDDRRTTVQRDVLVGARWRPEWELDVVPDATVAIGAVSALAFEAVGTVPGSFTGTRVGLSPGVGVAFPAAGWLDLRVDTTLLFAPLPVDGRVAVAGDGPAIGPVRPSLGLELDHRGWKVDAGALRQTRVVTALGVVAPL